MAATTLLAAGCADGGCNESRPPKPSAIGAIGGKERPVKVQPSEELPGLLSGADVAAAVPEPDGFPPATEQVLVDLRHKTLLMADVMAETDGRCDKDVVERVGFTTRCTVTYEGVKVPWRVEITSMGGGMLPGSVDFSYTAKPLVTVHTARTVYNRFASWLGGLLNPYEGRCDQIPNIFTAEPGREAGYRCQTLEWSCRDGDFHFTWSDVRIHISDEGNVTFVH
ncbi:MAG: hypothetical protein ACRDOO_12545 [Actinomadura sp.]